MIDISADLDELGSAIEEDKQKAATQALGGDKPAQDDGIGSLLFKFSKNLPQNIGTGLLDAAIQMYDTAGMAVPGSAQLYNEINKKQQKANLTPHQRRMGGAEIIDSDPVREAAVAFRNWLSVKNENTADSTTRSASQFLIPFLGWSKALKFAKAPTMLGKVAGAAAAEGATLATAFDPHEARLADLIAFGKQTEGKFADALNAVSPDGSAINAYIDYMTDRENESEAEGRFKNVVDGLTGSAVVAGLFKTAAKTFRGARALAESASAPIQLPDVSAPTHLVEGHALELPPRKLPTNNYRTDLSTYTPTLYRETSLDKLDQFTGGTRLDMSLDSLHFADNPDMALGQGSNKGVVLEFDSTGIQGEINLSKPGAAQSFESGMGEYIARLNHQPVYEKALRSVTIKPGAAADKVTKLRTKRVLADLERKGWSKTVSEDGTVKYVRPSPETEELAQQALQQFNGDPRSALVSLAEQADSTIDDAEREALLAARDRVAAEAPEQGVSIVPTTEGYTVVVGKQPLVTFLDEKDAVDAVADVRRAMGANFELRAAQEQAKASDKNFATLHSFSRVLQMNKDRPVSTHSLLSALEKNIKGDTEQGQFYKELLGRLVRKRLGGFTVVKGTSGKGIGHAGYWRGADNSIELYNAAFKNPDRLLHTFTHEAVHAATVHEMNLAPGVLRQMERLQKFVLKDNAEKIQAGDKVREAAEDAGETYGLRDPYEFVAEIESNPKFRKLMQETKLPDGGTAWDKYLETIAGILGITGLIATPQGRKEFSKLMMGDTEQEKTSA